MQQYSSHYSSAIVIRLKDAEVTDNRLQNEYINN